MNVHRALAISIVFVSAALSAPSDSNAQNPESPRDRCLWEGWLPPATARERVRHAARLTDSEVARLRGVAMGADKVAREQAIERLGAAEDDATVTLLADALADPDPIIVDAAVRALGRIGATSTLGAVESLASSANSHVRQGAVWALGQIQDTRALPTLLTASLDTSKHVRQEATWAIGLLHDKRGVMRLNELARDTSSHIRLSAACSLWLAGAADQTTRDTLSLLAHDREDLVREIAKWVLDQLDPLTPRSASTGGPATIM